MNLQNIPRKDKVVKRAFRPKLDAFVFCDYKNIELRLLAYYLAASLGDESMAQVFRDGRDLHAETAIRVLGLATEPTDEQRQIGKTLNFAIVYGAGPYKVGEQLGIGPAKGKEILDTFHAAWPGIKRLHNPCRKCVLARGYCGQPHCTGPGTIQQRIAERGYITTLWGRQLRPEQEHKALNALVQGCAADLMRAGLVKVHRYLGENLMASHLVLTIHDELVMDAVRAEIPTLVEVVPRLMDHEPVSKIVPIEVDTEVSFTTWADKVPYNEEVLLAV